MRGYFLYCCRNAALKSSYSHVGDSSSFCRLTVALVRKLASPAACAWSARWRAEIISCLRRVASACLSSATFRGPAGQTQPGRGVGPLSDAPERAR